MEPSLPGCILPEPPNKWITHVHSQIHVHTYKLTHLLLLIFRTAAQELRHAVRQLVVVEPQPAPEEIAQAQQEADAVRHHRLENISITMGTKPGGMQRRRHRHGLSAVDITTLRNGKMNRRSENDPDILLTIPFAPRDADRSKHVRGHENSFVDLSCNRKGGRTHLVRVLAKKHTIPEYRQHSHTSICTETPTLKYSFFSPESREGGGGSAR